MTTLRIEHAITDYQLWKRAFDGFAEARAQAGVRSFAIRLPVDDPQYLMLDLEFDSAGPAQTFADFLIQHVWSSPASSPGLAGTPQARILDLLPSSERQLPGAPAPDPARPAMQAAGALQPPAKAQNAQLCIAPTAASQRAAAAHIGNDVRHAGKPFNYAS